MTHWARPGRLLCAQKWSKGKQKEKVNNMVLFDKVGARCRRAAGGGCRCRCAAAAVPLPLGASGLSSAASPGGLAKAGKAPGGAGRYQLERSSSSTSAHRPCTAGWVCAGHLREAAD